MGANFKPMKRFLITSPKFSGTAELHYNDKDTLCKIDCTQAAMDEMVVKHFKAAAPATLQLLISGNCFSKDTIIVEADFEVTFDMFWNAYRHKVNKLRCLPLWNKLNKVEQVSAYYGISTYDKYLAKTGYRGKQDPDNYLRNKTWMNEYR